MTFDRKIFFDALRGGFSGPLEPGEVAGTDFLLTALAGLPLALAAYALATSWHETAGTMQPIRERGTDAYLFNRYDPKGRRPDIARRLGNTKPGDGVRFCGRGYPQCTGRANYVKASALVGVDLVAAPDRAMEPTIAAKIMREGMCKGMFTGVSFASTLPAKGRADAVAFEDARRIINGLDRADDIAGYALAYQAALLKAGWP